MDELRVVVIGHKDHGKSTLIGRLLCDAGAVMPDRFSEVERISRDLGMSLQYAFLLDSFQEERESGLTIDTAQALCKSGKYAYTFIDCPGHRELVRNMLTGASGSDAALAVVSADPSEGVQAETALHIKIARHIGIEHIVVAVTKMDTVGYAEDRFREVADAVGRVLAAAGWDRNTTPCVPVSAADGANLLRPDQRMAWYRGASLMDTLDARCTPPAALSGQPLRIPVQAVYHTPDGDYVVGKVAAGILHVGKTVRMLPHGAETRVARIKVNDRAALCAAVGDNVAVTFESFSPEIVSRGTVCCAPGDDPVTRCFKSRVFLPGETGVSRGDRLRVRCGTAQSDGVVSVVDGTAPFIEVTIELAEPMVVEEYRRMPPLGRVLLSAGNTIVAAGIVIECTGRA